MYPLTCAGGFNVPTGQGKFEICGFTCNVEVPGAVAHIAIADDPAISSEWTCGRLLGSTLEPPTEQKGILLNYYAGTTATALSNVVEWTPLEPIKTRHGISIHTENVKQGSFCLYVR